jgi:hypothetical protein
MMLKAVLAALALGSVSVSSNAAPMHTHYVFRATDEAGRFAYDVGLENPIGVSLPARVIRAGYACIRLPLAHSEDGYVYAGFACSDGKATEGMTVRCKENQQDNDAWTWTYKLPKLHYSIEFYAWCATQ